MIGLNVLPDESSTDEVSKPTAPVIDTESEEDAGITRGQFVKVAVGGMCAVYAGMMGYPIYRYLNSPVEKAVAAAAVSEVSLKDANKLPTGSALMFKFGASPALLIHHDDGSWVALDAVCTHLGCTVQYNKDSRQITCACHGGVYDAKTGDNISGPPPKPLKRYNAKIADDAVVITRA